MTIDQIKTFVLSPNAIRQMRYRYGIEPEEYYQLLLKTNGFCTLCEVPFSKGEKQGGTQRRGGHLPCVDHCYTTGEVRGLLCSSCNIGLGQFSDSSTLLKKAAKYIEENEMQNLNAEDIKQTQNVQILRYLQNRRAITQAAVITVFGCSRLAAVIHRRKKQGYPIETKMVKGFKGRYAEYALKDKNNAR